MKKLLAILLSAALLLGVSAALAACGSSDTLTLNVYNWGEYISDGAEGSLNTVKAFEQWYQETYGQKVKVNYTTYASNEDMYAKLSSGAVSYDVVIPSDYMIARMAAEDMLLPLNFDNIPNYEYINESFRGLYYDPDDLYTVPYTYGLRFHQQWKGSEWHLLDHYDHGFGPHPEEAVKLAVTFFLKTFVAAPHRANK